MVMAAVFLNHFHPTTPIKKTIARNDFIWILTQMNCGKIYLKDNQGNLNTNWLFNAIEKLFLMF